MNKKIEFDSFIKGELVDLVVLTEEVIDKTNWYKWFNDETFDLSSQRIWLSYSFKLFKPISRPMVQEMFKQDIKQEEEDCNID